MVSIRSTTFIQVLPVSSGIVHRCPMYFSHIFLCIPLVFQIPLSRHGYYFLASGLTNEIHAIGCVQ
jgi:hypothetical protein